MHCEQGAVNTASLQALVRNLISFIIIIIIIAL